MDNHDHIEFGTDGIRGIAGEYPLDPSTVLRIGRAIGIWLVGKVKGHRAHVIVGCDTRISGPMLLSILVGGLLAEGIEVTDATVMTTPGIAHLTRTGNFDLGIVISASHNPALQNGIKLFGADGFKVPDDDQTTLEAMIEGTVGELPAKSMGRFHRSETAHDDYVNSLVTAFDDQSILNDLTLIVDCANGAATPIARDAFLRLGAVRLSIENAIPDGLNINVNAGSEHVRRDRKGMLTSIEAHQADLGIAFDGDADRVVFVTPDGTLIDGDHVLGILALEMKAQGKLLGNTVVATEMSNSGLEQFLNDHDIRLERTKVGDRYVMERLRDRGFVLGGEQAGHIIILDDAHTSGDGIYVGLLVASLVARNKEQGGLTLYELAKQIKRYPQVIASMQVGRRVNLDQVNGLATLRDEILSQFDHKGRVNLRFSGTEPNLLRAMVEGGPKNDIEQVISRASTLCHLIAQAAQTPDPKIDILDCATGAPVASFSR